MELPLIKVQTLPNGYALTYEDKEYIYMSKEKLVEGFMYHVGFDEVSFADQETIRDLLAAAVAWKDNAETVKKLTRLAKENESMYNTIKNLKAANKRLRDTANAYGKRLPYDDEDDLS